MTKLQTALAQWEREWNWERGKHGLDKARERGIVGGQPSEYLDEVIRATLEKSGGSERGAAKIVGCKPITIRRRKEMWAKGKKLLHLIKSKKRKARKS